MASGSTAPGVEVLSKKREICWSAKVGQVGEPVEGCGDVAGPGPVPGQAEDSPTAGGHELSGSGEQAEP